MIVDLDRWLADEQEHVAEGRAFPHDVFISHRRFDLPIGVVDSLSALGAIVVWDCGLDLRDRRVMQGVAHAMRRSRFVALSTYLIATLTHRGAEPNISMHYGLKRNSISHEHWPYENLKLPCPASPKAFTRCAGMSWAENVSESLLSLLSPGT